LPSEAIANPGPGGPAPLGATERHRRIRGAATCFTHAPENEQDGNGATKASARLNNTALLCLGLVQQFRRDGTVISPSSADPRRIYPTVTRSWLGRVPIQSLINFQLWYEKESPFRIPRPRPPHRHGQPQAHSASSPVCGMCAVACSERRLHAPNGSSRKAVRERTGSVTQCRPAAPCTGAEHAGASRNGIAS